ncbi:hypothetical protein TPY_3339 [Sulfobacillus acidophilus TPY]|nr:hypothetical protein TPY_3339 [Sulfobacillus acidophilus TPY]
MDRGRRTPFTAVISSAVWDHGSDGFRDFLLPVGVTRRVKYSGYGNFAARTLRR